jgi:hypothetical protein
MQQEQFAGPAAGLALSDKTRSDYPRFVEHQQVVRPQQRRQIAKAAMHGGVTIEDHQSAFVALGGGVLRDQLCRQRVIVVAGVT